MLVLLAVLQHGLVAADDNLQLLVRREVLLHAAEQLEVLARDEVEEAAEALALLLHILRAVGQHGREDGQRNRRGVDGRAGPVL